jgi:hypothetical protein
MIPKLRVTRLSIGGSCTYSLPRVPTMWAVALLALSTVAGAAVAFGERVTLHPSLVGPPAWLQVLEREHGSWKSVATSYTPKFNTPGAAGASNPQPSSGSSTQ